MKTTLATVEKEFGRSRIPRGHGLPPQAEPVEFPRAAAHDNRTRTLPTTGQEIRFGETGFGKTTEKKIEGGRVVGKSAEGTTAAWRSRKGFGKQGTLQSTPRKSGKKCEKKQRLLCVR
jgi:hypothetical protein